MSDRAIVVMARAVGVASAIAAVVSATVIVLETDASLLLTEGGAFAVFAVFFAGVVWVVTPLQPRNRVVWILTAVAFGCSVYVAGWAVAVVASTDLSWVYGSFVDFVPAELPPAAARALVVATPIGTAGVLGLMTFGFLLFPDGTLPSPKWRWVAILDGLAIALTSMASVVMFYPSNTDSILATQLVPLTDGVTVVAVLISLLSLGRRFRSSSGEVRQQLKWVFWGAAVLVLSLGTLILAQGTQTEEAMLAFFALSGALFVGSYAVSVAKYRLFDIDIVISRTLVYGVLAIFIGVVYVAIAVLPWVVLGSEARDNTWLGIVATIVVAVSFQPTRRRLERLANRVVYGRRATPYEVLSSFSRGISAVDPEVLGQVAKSLAEGTTADSASIWVVAGESAHCIAAWPVLPDHLDPSAVAAPVVHEGEELGRVALEIAPGQPFPETDRRLLDQVAAGLGLALRNMQLTEDLRDRVDELAASRRRIVTVQDETRRQLERDLHDGAQQRLVALKIKLGIGSSMAEKAGLGDVRAMIDTVRDETDQTIDSVRDFARGIYPPLLEAEGLGQALSAQARKMTIPVTVQAAGLGRYPKEQEATVYFCVLEALQNAMKHSEASSVQVSLGDQDGELSFEVRDDGVGFDMAEVDPNGLLNMKDRVEAIGGEFRVDTQPSRGTRVFGSVPIAVLVGL